MLKSVAMRYFTILSFLLFTSVSIAQSAAEVNVQLRAELATVKAKCNEIQPTFDKFYQVFEVYSDSLLKAFKDVPYSKLVDTRMKILSYKDSIECINPSYGKSVSYENPLAHNKSFERAKDEFTPCGNVVGEILNIKYNVKYYPHEVVLDQKPVGEENEELKDCIEEYTIKNERMLQFLNEGQEAFSKGKEIEPTILFLQENYVLELAKAESYTAILKDTVSNARARYQADPQNSKYKYCFEKPKIYSENRSEPPVILEVVEEVAEFPGGREALNKYLAESIVYPEKAKKMGIEGKVYLKFVISATGNVSNVKVVRGITDCPECDAEAVRVVKGMPNWNPSKNSGKAVNSYYNLSVTFKIPD